MCDSLVSIVVSRGSQVSSLLLASKLALSCVNHPSLAEVAGGERTVLLSEFSTEGNVCGFFIHLSFSLYVCLSHSPPLYMLLNVSLSFSLPVCVSLSLSRSLPLVLRCTFLAVRIGPGGLVVWWLHFSCRYICMRGRLLCRPPSMLIKCCVY